MSITLRPYQNECIEGVRNAIANGNRKVAAILPTGSGKTTIFGAMCSGYNRKNKGTSKAIVVSHLGLLTKQTGKRFRKEWGLESEVLQAERIPSGKAETVITTMQSLRDKDKVLKWADRSSFGAGTIERLNVGLIIIDEWHRAGSNSYNEIQEMFPDAYIIGFTATPFRDNKLMTNLADCVAYTISTQELIDQGFLVPPVLKQISFNSTDQADMFSKILYTYKEYHMGEKSVVYVRSIEEAKTLRMVFESAGVKASAITAELTGDTRDEILEEFVAGRGPDVLTTVDVLTAGFDSPNLRSIFMPYKVGSVTTYLQRVGRGLRPDTGKDHCSVYVNSNAPQIEDGFWEKVNKVAMTIGKDESDMSFLEELEILKELMGKEKYRWTKEVVDMAAKVKAKGSVDLSNMIINKDFPQEMLEAFVSAPPALLKSRAKIKPTEGQLWYIEKNVGVNTKGLSKQDCSAIINAHKISKGWKPADWQVVQEGKYKGKQFCYVPKAYWKHVHKSTSLYKSYMLYASKVKEQRGEKKNV